eukprot:Colp12_sorted_trinity150504_noHs@6598
MDDSESNKDDPQLARVSLISSSSDTCDAGLIHNTLLRSRSYATTPSRNSVNFDGASTSKARFIRLYKDNDHPNLSGTCWSNEVDATVLAVISPKEQKRQEIIFEIIQTEQSYVHDLEVLEHVFIKGIKEEALLSSYDIDGIFANVMQLLPVHKQLLQALMARQAEQAIVQGVGDIFAAVVGSFEKKYELYIINRKNSERLLNTLRDKNKNFANFLKKCQTNAACRKLSLDSFLSAPFHRITKYPLLLRTLLKATLDENSDHDTIPGVLERIDSMVTSANERSHQANSIQRMVEIQSKIDYDYSPHIKKDFLLVTSSRRLIYDGKVWTWSSKGSKLVEVHMFLFNDLLLVTREKKDKLHLHMPPAPLEDVCVRDPEERMGPVSLSREQLSPTTSGKSPRPRDSRFSTISASVAAEIRKRSSSENDISQAREKIKSDKPKRHSFELILAGVNEYEMVAESEFDKRNWLKHIDASKEASESKSPPHASPIVTRKTSTASQVSAVSSFSTDHPL